MSFTRESLPALVSCLAVGLACSLSSSIRTQPPGSSPAIAATALPRSTATPQTSEEPQPTPAVVPTEKAPTPSATPFPEQELHTVTNDAGSITATIPTVWTDVRSFTWTNEQNVIIGHVLIASSNVEAFLRWEVEGVSISVSRNLGIGYVQLLESDYSKYREVCDDPYLTFWDFESSLHRGKYFVLDDCAGVDGGWLSVMSVVPPGNDRTYVAEVLAYDMPPTYGDEFRDIIMRFEVFTEKLP